MLRNSYGKLCSPSCKVSPTFRPPPPTKWYICTHYTQNRLPTELDACGSQEACSSKTLDGTAEWRLWCPVSGVSIPLALAEPDPTVCHWRGPWVPHRILQEPVERSRERYTHRRWVSLPRYRLCRMCDILFDSQKVG